MENMEGRKNIRDYIDVPEDRIQEIGRMAEKTILKSFKSLIKNVKSANVEEYNKFSDDNGKFLVEDIGNLKTIQEGIVYGMATQTFSDVVSKELATFAAIDGILSQVDDRSSYERAIE